MPSPRTIAHTLNDVARQLAPHLRIISSSQPIPQLRTYNVIALAETEELGRNAVLALESIEHADERLGTVVLAATAPDAATTSTSTLGTDPEGVTRQLAPRVLLGAVLGAIVGAIVIGAGAVVVGARGWEIVGAAAAGAMLMSVFGIIWLTFAGMGGSDA